jgi:predicted ATPase
LKRYVLTGAPGAGKTSVLDALRERGFPVVAEAATDVIGQQQARGVAEPWQRDDFVDRIVALQRDRLGPATAGGSDPGDAPGTPEVHDRSVLCTLALARFLGRPVTPPLAAEVARVAAAGVYERTVFLLRPLGFIVATAARQISYRDSLDFERLHEAAYREHGFEVIGVAAAPVAERAALIADEIVARG